MINYRRIPRRCGLREIVCWVSGHRWTVKSYSGLHEWCACCGIRRDVYTNCDFVDTSQSTCVFDRQIAPVNRVHPFAALVGLPKLALNWVGYRILRAFCRHHTLLQALGVV